MGCQSTLTAFPDDKASGTVDGTDPVETTEPPTLSETGIDGPTADSATPETDTGEPDTGTAPPWVNGDPNDPPYVGGAPSLP